MDKHIRMTIEEFDSLKKMCRDGGYMEGKTEAMDRMQEYGNQRWNEALEFAAENVYWTTVAQNKQSILSGKIPTK